MQGIPPWQHATNFSGDGLEGYTDGSLQDEQHGFQSSGYAPWESGHGDQQQQQGQLPGAFQEVPEMGTYAGGPRHDSYLGDQGQQSGRKLAPWEVNAAEDAVSQMPAWAAGGLEEGRPFLPHSQHWHTGEEGGQWAEGVYGEEVPPAGVSQEYPQKWRGRVTEHIAPNYGIIDGEAYFSFDSVVGPVPQVGDHVVAEAVPDRAGGKYAWHCVHVEGVSTAQPLSPRPAAGAVKPMFYPGVPAGGPMGDVAGPQSSARTSGSWDQVGGARQAGSRSGPHAAPVGTLTAPTAPHPKHLPAREHRGAQGCGTWVGFPGVPGTGGFAGGLSPEPL
eukprot:jgi/Botrbrau1/18638/Bobra.0367s0074.1